MLAPYENLMHISIKQGSIRAGFPFIRLCAPRKTSEALTHCSLQSHLVSLVSKLIRRGLEKATNVSNFLNLTLVASFFVLAGCSESPQDHFKSNQSGVSADYGIFYDGNPDDHVVTVHGFWDDHSVCEEAVKMLENLSNKGQSYACIKLN